jgi:hypothetical protein
MIDCPRLARRSEFACLTTLRSAPLRILNDPPLTSIRVPAMIDCVHGAIDGDPKQGVAGWREAA